MIKLLNSDITNLKVDAIVNAANKFLAGGGGVDGAIHRAAGTQLYEVCKLIGGCPTGEVRITPGFKLYARYIIHAVGPIWKGGSNNEKNLLASCYINAIQFAKQNNIKSIAFPNISTGVYGFPKELAAEIAINTVIDRTRADLEVTFCCFDEENFLIYQEILTKLNLY